MTLASDLPGLYGIAGASLAGCDAPAMMNTLGTSGAGPAVKCVVAFPLVYHYLGAVRHTVRLTRALPDIPTGKAWGSRSRYESEEVTRFWTERDGRSLCLFYFNAFNFQPNA